MVSLSILAISSIAQGAEDLSHLFTIKTRKSGFCNQTLNSKECFSHYDVFHTIWKADTYYGHYGLSPVSPAGCHKKVNALYPGSSGAYVWYNPDNESTANCSEKNQCICGDESVITEGTCATKMSYTQCDDSRAKFSEKGEISYTWDGQTYTYPGREQKAFTEDPLTQFWYLNEPMTTPKGCSVRKLKYAYTSSDYTFLQHKIFDYGESEPVECSEEAQCLCKEDMTGAAALASHVQVDDSMNAMANSMNAMANSMNALALENQLQVRDSMNAMTLENKAQVGKNHRSQYPLRTDAD